MAMTQRDLGRLEGKLDAIVEDISEGQASRKRIHDKLEQVTASLNDVKRDVLDMDNRLKSIEPTVGEISKWRERGIGAYMFTIFIASSVISAVVTYGVKIYAMLTGKG